MTHHRSCPGGNGAGAEECRKFSGRAARPGRRIVVPMGETARDRQVTALIARCYAGLDAAGLRGEVLRRVRRIMPVDAAFFVPSTATLMVCEVADAVVYVRVERAGDPGE